MIPGKPPRDAARLESRNRDRSAVIGQRGMVCASQPLAALIGVDMLKAGGTCVDAAIATNAALGLMEPASCGLGGDLFAIVWIEKDRRLYGLNASGRAPAAWTLEKARALGLTSIPRKSPLSWSVPGCVSGWQALSERFGRLGLAPRARALHRVRARRVPRLADHRRRRSRPGRTRSTRTWPRSSTPAAGSPTTATSSRTRSWPRPTSASRKGGPAGFYEGETAERIVAKSRELGGHMALGGPPVAPRRLGGARLLELPRLRRLGDPARTARASRPSRS